MKGKKTNKLDEFLEALESRVAIMALEAETDEEEKALYKAKAKLLGLVREMRNERREAAGLPRKEWGA